MQVIINIQPENEEKFIKALNDSNIPYWIEENKAQDISSDEADADAFLEWKEKIRVEPESWVVWYAACQYIRQQLSKETIK